MILDRASPNLRAAAATADKPTKPGGLDSADTADDMQDASVALSGTTALVGAPHQDLYTGAAYVFTRSGSRWTREARLTAPDTSTGDLFGVSVALSGTTALVGALGKNSGIGAVYVFTRSGKDWMPRAELIPSDGAAGDFFGLSVGLWGTTAVVGAPYENSAAGAVYVFSRSGTTWTQEAELAASDAAGGDQFGSSVAVSRTTALVGAQGKDSNAGAAYVFAQSGTGWTQQAELHASDRAGGDLFGRSVTLWGTTGVVGAPGRNSFAGAAYVFDQSGTGWAQQAELTASDGAIGDQFGSLVALWGTAAVVKAQARSSNAAAAYVFTRSGTGWTQQAESFASHRTSGELFGGSVAVWGTTAVAGAEAVTRTSCMSLSGCDLHGLDLANADLPGADLSASNLSGVNFTNANLTDANLSGAKSNLNGVSFAGANLKNANLSAAILTKADLVEANLSGANLTGAYLNAATWRDTTCPDGTDSDGEGGTCAGHL